MSPKRRLLPAALLICLTAPVAGLFVALSPVSAQAAGRADDRITAYTADATLTKDGQLQVKETVDLTAGGTTFSRTLTTRVRSDSERDRTYDLKDVSATVNGRPAQGFQNQSTDDGRKLTVNVSGQSKIVYSYTVDNVVADSTEGREVSWPIVQGFAVPVPTANLSVSVPFATWVTCFAGRTGSSMPWSGACCAASVPGRACAASRRIGCPSTALMRKRRVSSGSPVRAVSEFRPRPQQR